jgi:hypothetical protein
VRRPLLGRSQERISSLFGAIGIAHPIRVRFSIATT